MHALHQIQRFIINLTPQGRHAVMLKLNETENFKTFLERPTKRSVKEYLNEQHSPLQLTQTPQALLSVIQEIQNVSQHLSESS